MLVNHSFNKGSLFSHHPNPLRIQDSILQTREAWLPVVPLIHVPHLGINMKEATSRPHDIPGTNTSVECKWKVTTYP